MNFPLIHQSVSMVSTSYCDLLTYLSLAVIPCPTFDWYCNGDLPIIDAYVRERKLVNVVNRTLSASKVIWIMVGLFYQKCRFIYYVYLIRVLGPTQKYFTI